MTAEPLEAASLVDLAVRRLRAEILAGELAPGERIVEEQLTRRFGTSRAPLREALRLLGQQGLVGGSWRRMSRSCRGGTSLRLGRSKVPLLRSGGRRWRSPSSPRTALVSR